MCTGNIKNHPAFFDSLEANIRTLCIHFFILFIFPLVLTLFFYLDWDYIEGDFDVIRARGDLVCPVDADICSTFALLMCIMHGAIFIWDIISFYIGVKSLKNF